MSENQQKSSGTESEDPPVPRADWERNQRIIEEALFEHLKSKKRAPTISELAEVTGFDYNTVDKHLEHCTLDECAKPLKPMAGRIMAGQAQAAYAGNPAAAKLFFQVTHHFKEESIENIRDISRINGIGAAIVTSINEIVTDEKQKIALLRAVKGHLEKVSEA